MDAEHIPNFPEGGVVMDLYGTPSRLSREIQEIS
jgi:hypothetical protein